MPYFFYLDHQNKGDVFRDALYQHNYETTRDISRAEFCLSDSDCFGRGAYIDQFAEMGKPAFIYPHAARPDLIPDFLDSPAHPNTTAHFVSARGHVDIMRAYGYPHPLHVIGWTYCPIKPFEPRKQIKRVVFAPIHPSPHGVLSEIDRGINRGAFKKLLPLAKSGQIKLIVRYLYNLERCGIPKVATVHYRQGNPDLSYELIDSADVVVSHQTYAHIAIARGVPTVMMGEWLTPRFTLQNGLSHHAQSFDKYRSLLSFPLDILAEDSLDVMELFDLATRSDYVIADWRERMIGEPFNKDRFVEIIQSYLNGGTHEQAPDIFQSKSGSQQHPATIHRAQQ